MHLCDVESVDAWLSSFVDHFTEYFWRNCFVCLLMCVVSICFWPIQINAKQTTTQYGSVCLSLVVTLTRSGTNTIGRSRPVFWLVSVRSAFTTPEHSTSRRYSCSILYAYIHICICIYVSVYPHIFIYKINTYIYILTHIQVHMCMHVL